MFCTNCGEENDDSAKFCKKCGHPLTHEQKTETSDKTEHGPESESNPGPEPGSEPGTNNQGAWNQPEPRDHKNYKPIQLLALVMCVITGWFFLKNGIPALSNIVSGLFGDIFNGFVFWNFGRLFGVNILKFIQAASYALMALIMFTIFTRWRDEKAPEFMLTTIISAVIIVVIGFIRFIIFDAPLIRYGVRPTWFVWTTVTALASAGGLMAFAVSMGLPVKLVRDGDTFSDAVKNSFAFVYSDCMDEFKEIQAENARKNKAQEAGKSLDSQNGYLPLLRTNYSFVAYLFLGWITCGIYDLYLIHCFSKDINVTGQGDGENTMGVLPLILLSLATCGIFSYIYYYKLGNRVQRTGARYGLQIQESGTTMLLWLIFGALICFIGPYIAMYMLIKNINLLNDSYNRSASVNGQD